MSQKSFRALGVSAERRAGACRPRHQHCPFPSRSSSSRAPSPAPTCSRSRRPGRARPSPSACRSSSAPTASAPTPTALVLVPTRELASRWPRSSYFVAKPKRLRVAAAYGGALDRQPGQAAARRAHRRRHAGPAPGSRRAAAREARQRPDARARRGRPHARHGLQAAGREDRPPPAERAPDDALLGDARRRGRRARPRVHAQPGRFAAERPDDADDGEVVDHRFVSVTSDGKVDALIARARGGARARARLRPHEARSRPARRQAVPARTSAPSRCTAT